MSDHLKISEVLDGTLSASEQQAAETHLAGCAECRQQLDELKQIRALLKEQPVLQPPESFYAGVHARINDRPRPFWNWNTGLKLAGTVCTLFLAVFITHELRPLMDSSSERMASIDSGERVRTKEKEADRPRMETRLMNIPKAAETGKPIAAMAFQPMNKTTQPALRERAAGLPILDAKIALPKSMALKKTTNGIVAKDLASPGADQSEQVDMMIAHAAPISSAETGSAAVAGTMNASAPAAPGPSGDRLKDNAFFLKNEGALSARSPVSDEAAAGAAAIPLATDADQAPAVTAVIHSASEWQAVWSATGAPPAVNFETSMVVVIFNTETLTAKLLAITPTGKSLMVTYQLMNGISSAATPVSYKVIPKTHQPIQFKQVQ